MTKVAEFVQLLQKGRKPFPVGTVRTGKDGIKRRKSATGKWVPVKARKKYEVGATRTKDGKRYRLSEEGKWQRVKGRKPTRTTTSERKPKRMALSKERRQHLQTTHIPKHMGEFDHQREKEARQNPLQVEKLSVVGEIPRPCKRLLFQPLRFN